MVYYTLISSRAELYLVHANNERPCRRRRLSSYLLGRARDYVCTYSVFDGMDWSLLLLLVHLPPYPPMGAIESPQWNEMGACNQKLVHIDQFRVINRIHQRQVGWLVGSG